MDRTMTRSDAVRADVGDWGAGDWVLLLLAAALTLLLVALVVDLASRGRAQRPPVRDRLTLGQVALWLRVGAASAAVLAVLVVIWWVFARLVS